jgi:hypothetical protein
MKGRFVFVVLLGVAVLLMTAGVSQAAVIVLDFEGLNDLEYIEDYYDAGTGSDGSGPGPDYGIVFSDNAQALIDQDAGGTGNFGGEPSPDTIMFFLGGDAATMNVAAGFDTGFSFFYTAVNNPGSIVVYDGLNATGTVLASLNLPLTTYNGAPDPTGVFSPLVPIGVAFDGTAMSVDFGGTINQIGFDNITLGADVPGGAEVVPEPATFSLLAVGVAGLIAARRRRK